MVLPGGAVRRRKIARIPILALLVLAELGIYTVLEPRRAIALTVTCAVTATLLPVLLGQSGFWTAKVRA